ncbi:TRAP transporter large permease subunit, partial [Modicisalibacter coralii]
PKLGPPLTDADRDEGFSSRGQALKAIVVPGLIAFLVLGSIYGGVASVTEAAAMGVFGVLLAVIGRGEFSFKTLHESLGQTLMTCGMIIWIGIGAATLVGVYNLMGGNRFISQLILGLDVPPIAILLVMMAILLVLGMFLDWIGVAMLTLPIFVPIVDQLGYSPIWFGILFAVNMQVSFLSPPFGPAAFYLKGVAPPSVSLKDIFVSLLPFIAIQLVVLFALLFFPEIAMWLV